MAASRKTPKRAVLAKSGAKREGKLKSLEGSLPLSERDASQMPQNEELRRAQIELEAARDRYAALYDFSPAGHLTLDTSGKIMEANLRAGLLLGVNRKELIGQSFGHFVAQDDQDTLHRHCQEVLKTGTQHSCEVQLQEHAGAACCIHLESVAAHEEPGHSAHWQTALLDITERRRAEQEQARLIEDLIRSQKHFQSLFHWIPSAVGISTVADGRFIDVNEGFSRLTGYRREEVIGRTTLELGMWADPSQRAIVLQELQKQGSLHNREGNLRTKSGEIRSLMISVHPIQLGATPCLIYLAHDITDRKRAEEALRKSEDRYRALYQDSPFMYFTVSADGTILSVNRLGAESLGFLAEELIGRSVLSIFHEEDRAAARVSLDRSLANPTDLATWEFRKVRKDGTILWVRETVRLVEDDGGALVMLIACKDITDRKRAETELCESEARLRAILDNSPGMVLLKDPEGRYLHVNRQFEKAFQLAREHVVGKTDEALFAPEQAAAFRANDLKVFQAGVPLEFEEVALHDDGPHTSIVSKFPLSDGNGTPYALCAITTDITWRKTVEEALRSSEVFTRAVLNSLSAHVCVLDKEGVIVTTNDAWKEFARQHVDRAFISGEVGHNYLDRCRQPPAADTVTGQAILTGVEDVLLGRARSVVYEYACRLPDEECWFLMRVTPLKDAKGVVMSHTDISRRVRMGLALEQKTVLLGEKQKELESLAGKLIEAQEAERKRIARELHDDFNQRLAALSVELESMERAPIALPEPIARQLAAIRVQTGMLSDDLHDLAYRLHPSLLEHVGLEVAARDHVSEFAKRTGLSVRFIGREVPKTLSPEVATNLFRVLQESLQNVSKHAQATDVTVRLSGSSKGVGLSVRDNGKGFDFEDKNAGARGLGLVSMQERTRGLGGLLRVHSMPRSGTKICAWIPIYRRTHEETTRAHG